MPNFLSAHLNDSASNLRSRILSISGAVLVLNAGAWLWAVVAFRHYPVLLGTAFLAYTFGLRHGVDADHIAAIDAVTRKLMHEGKRPVAVGFLFSMGHSTLVILCSAVIAVTTISLQHRSEWLKQTGGVAGTMVSALFLFAIATSNLIVLRSIVQTFRRVRSGGRYVEEDFDFLLASRGFLARLFRPVFALIRRSWHMFPLGFLFGLGFDTATEIGLLGMSASEASTGLSLWSIMVFPALFAAGMSLVDTTDNILMLGAYGWAFAKPVRKLYYNMTITFLSAAVALLVGGIEMLGLMGDRLHLQGVFWEAVGILNRNFGMLGYFIVGLFTVSWLISIWIYKWRGYDMEPCTEGLVATTVRPL
jgi:nickel/cobalt transporter (NiCoT) family protein